MAKVVNAAKLVLRQPNEYILFTQNRNEEHGLMITCTIDVFVYKYACVERGFKKSIAEM